MRSQSNFRLAALYHYDGIGSVTNVTDAAGLPQWSYSYDAFGNSRSATKLNPLAPDNPMRFTGEYLDPTGLYHLRARQYDPGLGRFTATDPWTPPITSPAVSPYAYVNNRPTVLIDPSGRTAVGACVSVKAGIFKYFELGGCFVGTDGGQFGFTGTAGSGEGSGVSAGFGVGGFVSDADYLEDLEGPFDTEGGAIGVPQGGFGGQGQVGVGACGQSVAVGESSFGPSVGGTPFVTPERGIGFIPGEFYQGSSYTESIQIPWVSTPTPTCGDRGLGAVQK